MTAKATAAIDSRVTLNDIAGITGQLNAGLDAKYTPTGRPVATLDAFAGYELGACLACFWSDSPAKVTMLSGTFFNKRIATYDSVPSPAGTASPLALTATYAPIGTAGTAYRAEFAAAGGTRPYTWSVTGGQLPAGNFRTGTQQRDRHGCSQHSR